jgi:transposase
VKSWCLPIRYNSKSTSTAKFVAKMEDVLCVYERPYDPDYPVVCIDEKNKELRGHGAGRAPLPPRPSPDKKVARDAREDYEYKRGGMANIFMLCEPLRGWRRVAITERRTAVDFALQLQKLVDEDFPRAKKIVLVTDNLNTHTMWSLYETFTAGEARRILDKIEWHYTPEHGSWLNMAEIELSVMQQQCLNRRIPDAPTLQQEATAWERERNSERGVINWQFTTKDARIKLLSLYPVFP